MRLGEKESDCWQRRSAARGKVGVAQEQEKETVQGRGGKDEHKGQVEVYMVAPIRTTRCVD